MFSKSAIHSKEPGTSDPLFNAVEAGVAKPDPNLSVAAVQGRIGPRLDAPLDAHRAAFQLLQRVLNGDGKASRSTAFEDLMRRTPYLAQARGSYLLSHILGTMEQMVMGKAVKGAIGPVEARLVVLSGHDTNMSNLAGMLGLSWALPSHKPDDVPPGGALIFSLWRSLSGEYSVRLQFVAQTLEQMHRATPLTIQNPPAIANLFVPGCSRARDEYPCGWSNFSQVAKNAIAPAFVDE